MESETDPPSIRNTPPTFPKPASKAVRFASKWRQVDCPLQSRRVFVANRRRHGRARRHPPDAARRVVLQWPPRACGRALPCRPAPRPAGDRPSRHRAAPARGALVRRWQAGGRTGGAARLRRRLCEGLACRHHHRRRAGDQPGRGRQTRLQRRRDAGRRPTVTAQGNFEVVAFARAIGAEVRNLIIVVGDGMGAAERTAARIVKGGASVSEPCSRPGKPTATGACGVKARPGPARTDPRAQVRARARARSRSCRGRCCRSR